MTSASRLEELVVLLSIFEDALVEVTPLDLLHAARAICDGDLEAADAAAAAHAGNGCSGVLHMTAESSSTDHAPRGISASLVFTMPPVYPGAAALQCHITSTDLPRATVDALSQQLQQQATAAQGSECLHDLAATLQEELNKLQQQQEEDNQQQHAQDHLQQQQDPGNSYRMVLLRLDHMRDRAGYSAIIKQWAAELHLTGWLLFWQSLILILLEGTSRDISMYLRQARTVCVDVDSNGRKCRERMLTILEDSEHAAVRGGTSTSASKPLKSSPPRHHIYHDFRELNVDSLEDVVRQLSATHPNLDAQALRKMLGLA